MTVEYQIFVALRDDMHQGWVWLKDASLPARCVVKITNQANGRSIYCEALQIEQNFLTKYNDPGSARCTIVNGTASLVIGAWFRAGLGGLRAQQHYPLEIAAADNCWGKLRAGMHHPQIIVRVAVWLGVLGVVLGAIGVLLGAISIWPKR